MPSGERPAASWEDIPLKVDDPRYDEFMKKFGGCAVCTYINNQPENYKILGIQPCDYHMRILQK